MRPIPSLALASIQTSMCVGSDCLQTCSLMATSGSWTGALPSFDHFDAQLASVFSPPLVPAVEVTRTPSHYYDLNVGEAMREVLMKLLKWV